MSKLKYIIICFLLFILIKNTESIEPKENNDKKNYPERDKRFPPRKPYKDKYINETNRFRQREKFGKLIKESYKLKKLNERLIIIIIILVGIILIIISLYLFVKYYNKCSTQNQ